MSDIFETIGTEATKYWKVLEAFFYQSYDMETDIRFPFGNNYGWGVRFKHRNKTLCYFFPENGAFTVFFQIGKNEISKMLDRLEDFLPKTKEIWENRYPCGEGGWLYYRVLNPEEINDIIELMKIRKKPVR